MLRVAEKNSGSIHLQADGEALLRPQLSLLWRCYLHGSDPNTGLIIDTNTACKIKGQFWVGIPTLVWPDGVDEVASDWLRTLVVDYGVATSSAREYAKIIRPFLRFCKRYRRAWQSVDDEFLILWREHLRRSKEISTGRVNASLKTIFAFYRWAEENRHIRFQVGIYVENELPATQAHIVFPISAKRSYTKGRHGRVFGGWMTPGFYPFFVDSWVKAKNF